jgi:hypothetical protein
MLVARDIVVAWFRRHILDGRAFVEGDTRFVGGDGADVGVFFIISVFENIVITMSNS